MKAVLITVSIFLALLAPFFLFLAILRFIPERRRRLTVDLKLGSKRRPPPIVTFLFELLGGLF